MKYQALKKGISLLHALDIVEDLALDTLLFCVLLEEKHQDSWEGSSFSFYVTSEVDTNSREGLETKASTEGDYFASHFFPSNQMDDVSAV